MCIDSNRSLNIECAYPSPNVTGCSYNLSVSSGKTIFGNITKNDTKGPVHYFTFPSQDIEVTLQSLLPAGSRNVAQESSRTLSEIKRCPEPPGTIKPELPGTIKPKPSGAIKPSHLVNASMFIIISVWM